MSKPNGFQIEIHSQEEFNRAWGTLSPHYRLTTNADEQTYRKGCIIKAGNCPEVLWSSVIGKTQAYTTYVCWDEFISVYDDVFTEKERPTFNHCAELVSLDQEMAIMQIEIADMEAALNKHKETLQNYLTRTEELNIILGIK